MSRSDVSQVLPTGWSGSTYRNSAIRSYDDVRNRVMAKLGTGASAYINDNSMAQIIDEAIERYSRYAGYDEEYVVFCDDALDPKCSINLGDIVSHCTCTDETNTVETTYISSFEVIDTLVGTNSSILSSYTTLSSNGEEAVNLLEEVDVPHIDLFFDPNDPWDFDVCDVNKVVITPSPSGTTEICSPILSSLINVSDGDGEFYPPNYVDLDPCGPLSSWWGAELSGCDLTEATHIDISGVPACTVGGLNALKYNNGRGGKFGVDNLSLDTCGDILAQIQFVKSNELPSSLSGEFEVIQNTGFKLKLDPDVDPFICTPTGSPVDVSFYTSVSSTEYGVSSTFIDPFLDPTTGCKRKVVSVFDVNGSNSTGGIGGGVFGFQTDLANSLFGYGCGLATRGYDLVTYDLSLQYIEHAQKLFGGGSYTPYTFDVHNQSLNIQGRNTGCPTCYLIGVYLERPIQQMISETWVLDYVEALTKITIGNTLNQYSGAQTIGGIVVNGTDVLSQGLAEKEALLAWLRETPSEGGCYPAFMVY